MYLTAPPATDSWFCEGAIEWDPPPSCFVSIHSYAYVPFRVCSARWNDDENSYEATCQSCGKKFSKIVQLEWSAS